MTKTNAVLDLKNMRKHRIMAGYTQKYMAELLGLKTVSAYSKKESGESPITLIEGCIIANAFGESIESIFTSKTFPNETEVNKSLYCKCNSKETA